MKKFISFALAASMVISMVPATAFASSDLSTSHSNIRTTSNSEFLPKSIADQKDETYREIPYILLEAKSNFNNQEQTFELALENAEWLEVDGTWTNNHRGDDDKLYMEIGEIMTNSVDGVKFEPDGYNPNAKPDDGTTTPTTPTTPSDSKTVEATEKAYRDAIDKMLEAKKAYEDASTAAGADFATVQKEYDAAVAALKAANEAVDETQKEYEDATSAYSAALTNQAEYEALLATRADDTYQDYLKQAVKFTTAWTNSGDVLTGATPTTTYDGQTIAYYSAAAPFYASAADVTGDVNIKDVLSDSALYLAKADRLDSAPTAAGNGETCVFIKLTEKGMLYLGTEHADTSDGWIANSAISGISNGTVRYSASDAVAGSNTAGDFALGETAIEDGIAGEYIDLSEEGRARDRQNKDYRKAAIAALEYLQDIEEKIADLESDGQPLNEAEMNKIKSRAENAGAERDDAVKAKTDAEKALAEAEAKIANYADANAKLKAYQDTQTAREKAAIDYMSAYKNANGTAGDEAGDTELGHAVNVIDANKKVPADLTKSDKQWGDIYRQNGGSGKSAVAEEFSTDVVPGSNDKQLKIDIQRKSDTRIVVTTSGYTFRNGDVLKIPMFVRTTGGIAKVSIDSLDSEFTSEGKTFARTSDGDTKFSVEKVQNFYDSDEIKNLYIEELVPGTLEPSTAGTGRYISLRVNGDFQFRRGANFKITQITGDGLAGNGKEWTDGVCAETKNETGFKSTGDKSDEIYIKVPAGSKSTKAVQLRIEGLQIAEDGADFGDEATVTVSGGGTSKETITIGTYEDYGVKLTAEDKDLPVVYAGTRASNKYDNQTLKVTIEETVANSFINNRKMELTLPDGVEFVADNDSIAELSGDIDEITEDFKLYNFAGSDNTVKKAFSVDKDGGKITINSRDLGSASEAFDSSGSNKDRRRKIEFSVHVSAAADFTGDVVMTLSGAAVADREMSATIATVKAPIEVKTDVNELKIDYRNTDIADITLIEPEAGLWAKNDEIYIEGERMSFEDGAKAEVVSGDMKLDKLDGDYVDTDDEGDDDVLYIKVDSRSNKTPAEIKISNLSLYMNRALAAGDYKLKVFGNSKNEFFMNNYHKDGDDLANGFETQKVTVMSDFVKVVTAGREQDDSTFTTQVVVPIGSDVIQAGSREIKLSEMAGGACPAAYINNDGYTMLPVRAVTEALNGIAIVRWDDATKTCTVSFGQRVFSMTVGSKVLNMNGVSTALNAAPEIRDSRVFLPLRDLGYALGLSESQISWDATTQTARLN